MEPSPCWSFFRTPRQHCWGIDPASPDQVRQAQIGLERRPSRLDHDALADSVIDRHTVYHFYLKNAWTLLDTPN